jgi:hypothetical protein
MQPGTTMPFGPPQKTNVLETQSLRALMVAGSGNDPAPRPLSAASGLVRIGQRLYVVADDENDLGVFDLEGAQPGQRWRLIDAPTGAQSPGLSGSNPTRKALKRDLESLTLLPALTACPHGALLALGSGSRPNRQLGALLPLDASGQATAAVQLLDLSALYAPLQTLFAQPNIEGAFVDQGSLCLLQRGHQSQAVNACLRLDLQALLQTLPSGRPSAPVQAVQRFDLGARDGVALCFTDGAACPGGGWVFSAAAEATDDSYADGACAGSAVGFVNAAGALQTVQPLRHPCKAEGISVTATATGLALLLVTDADDRRVPAQLLSALLVLP